jgi:hypothetical protein
MPRYVISEARLSLPREDFDRFKRGKSKATQARYERDYIRYRGEKLKEAGIKPTLSTIEQGQYFRPGTEPSKKNVTSVSASVYERYYHVYLLQVELPGGKKDTCYYCDTWDKKTLSRDDLDTVRGMAQQYFSTELGSDVFVSKVKPVYWYDHETGKKSRGKTDYDFKKDY